MISPIKNTQGMTPFAYLGFSIQRKYLLFMSNNRIPHTVLLVNHLSFTWRTLFRSIYTMSVLRTHLMVNFNPKEYIESRKCLQFYESGV